MSFPIPCCFTNESVLRERISYLESAIKDTRRDIVNEVAAAALDIKSDTTRLLQICAGLTTGIQRLDVKNNLQCRKSLVGQNQTKIVVQQLGSSLQLYAVKTRTAALRLAKT